MYNNNLRSAGFAYATNLKTLRILELTKIPHIYHSLDRCTSARKTLLGGLVIKREHVEEDITSFSPQTDKARFSKEEYSIIRNILLEIITESYLEENCHDEQCF